MNAQEFAKHTHDQEIQRLVLLVERLRKQREEWRKEATRKSLEVGTVTEQLHQTQLALEAAQQEIRRRKERAV